MNRLALETGADIPFPEAQLVIHQPTLKELGLIGESGYLSACELLNFSKEKLSEQDKNNLKGQTNFDIIMSIIKDKNPLTQQKRFEVISFLMLLFPGYDLNFDKKYISLVNLNILDENSKPIEFQINNKNYEAFRDILIQIFCLKNNDKNPEYNPAGDRAKQLAEKFKKRKQKLAEIKDKGKDVTVFDKYISILSVGLAIDVNDISNYTMYQLMDTYKRFELKNTFDATFRAKLAGAKDIPAAEPWTKDLYNEEEKRDSIHDKIT